MNCDFCSGKYYKSLVLGHRKNKRLSLKYCKEHYEKVIKDLCQGNELCEFRKELGLVRNIQKKSHTDEQAMQTQRMSDWKKVLSS